MKLLVTGFEPFNGGTINPSELILKELPAPFGTELVKEVLPVEFAASAKRLSILFFVMTFCHSYMYCLMYE